MFGRALARDRGVRMLGVGFLILGLVHTPLPEPDYHNIRHHDAPGEICEHHDHLLRWHPDAGSAADVALLHWHWLLPVPESADRPLPGSAPAVHANCPDWPASTWEAGPQLPPDTASRFVGRLASPPQSTLLPMIVPDAAQPGPLRHPPLAFSATFARRAILAALLQRWVC
jgi:hypothetical protein